jgi:hypothetical protein
MTMPKLTAILLVLAVVVFSSAMAQEEERDIFYLRGEQEGELIGEDALRNVSPADKSEAPHGYRIRSLLCRCF